MILDTPSKTMTPFLSKNKNKNFQEIKNQLKLNMAIYNNNFNNYKIQVNNLIKQKPSIDSSNYVLNSEIKDNEVMKNINVHKMSNNVIKSNILNNSIDSETIEIDNESYMDSFFINN